jgi:MYXO-CTERM domain-containing protein
MRRGTIALGLAAVLTFGGAPSALAAPDDDPAPPTTTTTTTDDDGGNAGLWGLVGLLGLAGLAGLRRQEPRRNSEPGTEGIVRAETGTGRTTRTRP